MADWYRNCASRLAIFANPTEKKKPQIFLVVRDQLR
eukprot:SAG22_NODE_23_length_31399_cov_35.631313_16_plen_36_part_00